MPGRRQERSLVDDFVARAHGGECRLRPGFKAAVDPKAAAKKAAAKPAAKPAAKAKKK